MKLHRVDPVAGAALHSSGGQLARFLPLMRAGGDVFAGILHLGPGGKLGPHEAAVPRLVLVVRGSGQVAGSKPEDRADLRAGDAVLWELGESIQIETSEGLMGIVIEGIDLQVLSPSTETRTAANQGGQ